MHLNALWIPDWMLSERIIFHMPPFTNSDGDNKGIPYVMMLYFRWKDNWEEYCRQSDEHRSSELPDRSCFLRSNTRQRYFHQRPWILNDENAYVHGRVCFPSQEETREVRKARYFAKAGDPVFDHQFQRIL